jgi:putative RNA 2'-phosphotransferase
VSGRGSRGSHRRLVAVSRYLARHLRHRPERIGLVLDGAGWASVQDLLAGAARDGHPIAEAELAEVVARGDKPRYELDLAGGRIRARYGHSVHVDLGLDPATPPDVLYHGTVERWVAAILRGGLEPMDRQHVHLSSDVPTAQAVGRRRGPPVVLSVDARGMARVGHLFFPSGGGVWLTGHVPARFLARRRAMT